MLNLGEDPYIVRLSKHITYVRTNNKGSASLEKVVELQRDAESAQYNRLCNHFSIIIRNVANQANLDS